MEPFNRCGLRSPLLGQLRRNLEDLHPGLGHDLQTQLEEVEKELSRDDAFQRYQRLALAEAVMERDGSRWSVGSYLDFSKRYDDQAAFLRQALAPAEVFVQRLPDSEWALLLDRLNAIGRLVAEHTHIAWRM